MKITNLVTLLSLLAASQTYAMSQDYRLLSHKEHAPAAMKLTVHDLVNPKTMNLSEMKSLMKTDQNIGVIYHNQVSNVDSQAGKITYIEGSTSTHIENFSPKPVTFTIYTRICPDLKSAKDCGYTEDTIQLTPFTYIDFMKSITAEHVYAVAGVYMPAILTSVSSDELNSRSFSYSVGDAIVD